MTLFKFLTIKEELDNERERKISRLNLRGFKESVYNQKLKTIHEVYLMKLNLLKESSNQSISN